ncbi:MAG: family 20 glycosylhydrolase [Alistipes sp.]|nr:family 20 glycosylhydrolase [Alistipes sp.]
MKKLFILLCALAGFSTLQAQVMPKPKAESYGGGEFTISEKSCLVYDSSVRNVALYMLDYLPFKQILSSSKVMPGDVQLTVNRLLAEEEYRLTVNKQNIKIEGGSYAGVFNGVQTLLQLLPAKVYNKQSRFPLAVPCCKIDDSPKFSYRGFMLDVARTWIPADKVKRYIDLMSHLKLNKLHFHLTDDEGWRIEILSHPELAQVGGFRGGDSPVFPRYGKFYEKWGGYYTQQELREIVAYAAQRNIEVIPEVDMPGHSKALGAIRSDILCNYTPDKSKTNGLEIRNVWCAAKESNYALIDDIIREMSTIFTSDYIHIGGDEVNMSQWRKCPDCQRLKVEKGLENEKQIEDYFIARTTAILAKYGKKPAVWNEGIEGGLLPKTTRVHGWESIKKCLAATSKGYPTIIMPGHYFYFDMKQSSSEPGHNWAAIFDAKKVLSFDFAKEGFTAEHLKNVAGIEASFFSEIYIAHNPETSHYLDYMLFPRLIALSEVAWSHSRRSWEEFYSALKGKHYARMDAMGVTYRLETPKVTYANGTITATTADGSTLYYTDTRTGKTSRYNKPIATSAPYAYEFVSRKGSGESKKTGSKEYYARLKPAVTVTSSIPCSSKTPMTNAAKYTNSIVRTTRAAKAGDWIEYRFAEPVSCREIEAMTGHIHLRRCNLLKGCVEVSYDGVSFVPAAEFTVAGATIKPTAPVRAVRIVAKSNSDAEDQIVIQSLKIK